MHEKKVDHLDGKKGGFVRTRTNPPVSATEYVFGVGRVELEILEFVCFLKEGLDIQYVGGCILWALVDG